MSDEGEVVNLRGLPWLRGGGVGTHSSYFSIVEITIFFCTIK